MTDKKKTSLGRRLGYSGIALIVISFFGASSLADTLAGLGLLLLIIGVVRSFVEGRQSAGG